MLQDLFAILFLAIQPNLRDTGVEVVLLSFGRVLVLVAVAFCASRYLLPALFRSVARLPELVLVGALAWCFLMAGLAGLLQLSREMGALVAGVAISTFPYTLDISAKVASLRDFFVTLFFVALGMAVPKPSWALLAWAMAFASLLVATRVATVFPLLYGMRQGHRASLLTSFQLAQVSELGLVIMALGASAGQVSEFAVGVVSYAFVILAVVSGYVLVRKHSIVLACSGWLKRAGLKDLDQSEPAADLDSRPAKLFLLGFSWTASSLLEEISRNEPSWIKEMTVLDFNPHVNQELKARKIRVIYGDVSQRETLLHAEVNRAKVIVSTLPNSVLKGTNNVRLARELRELNPEAKIIMHAELLSDVPRLYAAGADFVCVPRIIEAEELRKVIEAAMENLLEEKRLAMDRLIAERDEVIP